MTDTTRVNFHCHSNLSDGYLSPEALAEQLAAAGVRYAALTDHDTTAGLSRFHETLGRFGIGCIPGLEIFATLDGREIHLLAYGFDPEHPAMRHLLPAVATPAPGALVDSLKGSWARIRRKDAVDADDDRAVALLPAAADAMAWVRQAGGQAFLAHPLSLGADLATLEAMVVKLAGQGLDGLEAFYGPYPAASRQLLLHLAEKHGLAVVAGTDFHGPTTPGLSLPAIEMPTPLWKAFRRAVVSRRRRPAAARAAPTKPVAARDGTPRWRSFFAHIVLPTLLALCLFATAVFAVIVPSMRQTLLDRKRDQIRELTQSAWSILAEYEQEAAAGALPREEAQRLAGARIQSLRYGKEGKDYFWITDLHPRMVMHPYRPDLNGQDLSGYTDPLGNRIFVEFVKVVRERQAGYVDYVWQWKDQPERLAPKESYVKAFPPWGWIIGTGMYLEDVQAEIGLLLRRLIWLFVAIILLLALLLLYVVRQSLKIEQQRTRSEAALRESHEKYRALVEVATEGTMMVLDGRCTYCNATMLEMLGYEGEEFLLLDAEDLLPEDADAAGSPLTALLAGQPAPGQFEARLRRKSGEPLQVMAAGTPISFGGKRGFILVAKDLRRQERVDSALLGAVQSGTTLAEQAQVGVFRVAAGRRKALVQANPPARRLLGVEDGGDLTAVDFLERLLDPRDRADLLQALESRGVAAERIVRLRDAAGAGVFAALTLVAVRGEDGAVTHWDGLIQDVTRQRKLELQRESLIAELQTSLLFLNDPIKQAQYQPPRCRVDTSIAAAADQMTRARSSALFVTAEAGAVLGLVTDRDFRERVAARGLHLARPVVEIMSAPLVSVPDTALVYEAILAMQAEGKRHLAVRDAAGEVTGLVTNLALLHFDRYSSVVMTREIGGARRVEELARVYERLPGLVGALVDSGARPRNVTRVITACLDAVVNRLIALGLEKLGPPPGPFAFVALGSEGREEKTLVSDQDNALVYADPPAEDAARVAAYYLDLGALVCDGLAKIGCPYCRGGIMAKTREWCQPLSVWKGYFSRWIETAQPQDFLEINMFFDLRAMHGDAGLLAELRQHIARRLRLSVPFFVNYAQNALLYKPPTSPFGGLVADSMGLPSKTLNLKDALRPIIAFARLYSLQHGLSATNTLDRLQQLLEREAVKRQVGEEAVTAYNHLMDLRLQQQVAALRRSVAPGNDIEPRALTTIQASTLKQALLQVGTIQRQIQHDFIGTTPTL